MAASKQVDYQTSNTSTSNGTASTWWAQTFLTSNGFSCTSVKVYIAHGAGVAGTFGIELYATSGGEPTGSALAAKTFASDDTVLQPSLGWYEVTWDTPVFLDSATTYAIVFRFIDGGQALFFALDTTHSYADGASYRSLDSGGSWTSFAANFDMPFEVWGEAASFVELSASGVIPFTGIADLSKSTAVELAASGVITLIGTADLTKKTVVQGVKSSGTNLIIGLGNDELWFEDV
jgi:hypothetical protein